MKKKLSIFLICLVLVTSIPFNVIASQGNIKVQNYLSAGPIDNFILKPDGTVWNVKAVDVADETKGYKLNPIKGLNNIISISSGGHNLALKNDGTVWAWGYNHYGQLGIDTTLDYTVEPIKVEGLHSIKQISAGDDFSLALKDDGTVYAWGDNNYGQLGIDTEYYTFSPTKIERLSDVKVITAGTFNAFALKNDGTVWAWGSEWGNTTDKHSTIPIHVKELTDIINIDAQTDSCIALKNDGSIFVWGGFYNSKKPLEVDKLDNVIKVYAGRQDYYALKADGTLWTWYSDDSGKKIPKQVENLENVVEVACGSYDEYYGFTPGHSIALTEDGSIYQWGYVDEDFLYIPQKAEGVEVILEKNKDLSKSDNNHLYNLEDPGLSIVLPYDNISKITNKEIAIQTVVDVTKKLTEEQKSSPTGIDLITLFSEEALSQASSTIIEGNDIEINSQIITPLQTIANQTKSEIEKSLIDEGITTAREISIGVKLKIESTKDLKITLDKSILTTKTERITVESPNISVKIDTSEIKEDLKDDPLTITITEGETVGFEDNYQLASLEEIQIAATVKKTYTINFNRAAKENVTVSLPKVEGDVKYQAVIKEDGTVIGGKYNPAKNTIDVKIKESGKYTVKENKKDFTDIQNKSKEMQEAIKLLASKGIIAGNSPTTFNPDGPISRAEIAALIVRTLSKVDKTAKVEFKDVKSNDWFYNIAGSSKKYGIIAGYDDNTFRGKEQIKKDQIIAVAARTLRQEMKYKDPKDIKNYLGKYKDNEKIANWAQVDISLATRENLVLKRVDGNFKGDDNMTRGDAAIIIKRLFDKIW